MKFSKIMIFGTGKCGTEWYYNFKNFIEIIGFIDNDPNKQKNYYLGLPVYSVENLTQIEDAVVIICIYDEATVNKVVKQVEEERGLKHNENLFRIKDFLSMMSDEEYLKIIGCSSLQQEFNKNCVHSNNLNYNDKLLINAVHRSLEDEKKLIEVYTYIGKYVAGTDLIDDNAAFDSSVLINHTIWVCWLQGLEQAPKLVQKCIDSIEKNKPDNWSIELITFNNVKSKISLPEFIWQKHNNGIISNTHLSDIIRLELLNRYGGCWIDATVFCSAKIPLYMLQSDLFFFKLSVMDKSILKHSSWWIASGKGSDIIRQTLLSMYRYWEHESYLLHYYLIHIIFSKIIEYNKQNLNIFRNMVYMNNSNPHLLQRLLAAPFDLNKWSEIKNISGVHKLTYKQNFHIDNSYTFYDALLEDRLSATETL